MRHRMPRHGKCTSAFFVVLSFCVALFIDTFLVPFSAADVVSCQRSTGDIRQGTAACVVTLTDAYGVIWYSGT